jgi:hypothetical protein
MLEEFYDSMDDANYDPGFRAVQPGEYIRIEIERGNLALKGDYTNRRTFVSTTPVTETRFYITLEYLSYHRLARSI